VRLSGIIKELTPHLPLGALKNLFTWSQVGQLKQLFGDTRIVRVMGDIHAAAWLIHCAVVFRWVDLCRSAMRSCCIVRVVTVSRMWTSFVAALRRARRSHW
jgi:hypothetical protein